MSPHLGPRPAALGVHAHVAGVVPSVVPIAPIATRVPSEDIDTEYPDCRPQPRRRCRRPPGSTSRRSRRTRARGRRRAVPSFRSADRHARAVRGHRYRRTRIVSAASPSMSAPTWVHVPPLSAYTRTWPALCRCRRYGAPIATRVPSDGWEEKWALLLDYPPIDSLDPPVEPGACDRDRDARVRHRE